MRVNHKTSLFPHVLLFPLGSKRWCLSLLSSPSRLLFLFVWLVGFDRSWWSEHRANRSEYYVSKNIQENLLGQSFEEQWLLFATILSEAITRNGSRS